MMTARVRRRTAQSGFTLVEMLVAITVTLIIMGSVYGLMGQGQAAFSREPLLADRQQQARIALGRIQSDIMIAGEALGTYFQAFATGLNAAGPVGIRASADTAFGGGRSDYLEIRAATTDCPSVRTEPGNELSGANINTVESIPPCYPEPGYVLLLYPDGRAKFGWLHNQHSNGNDRANFPGGQQPPGSQIINPAPHHIDCSIWFDTTNGVTSPNGNSCPPEPVPPDPYGCPSCAPYAIAMGNFIRYQIGMDDNGTVSTDDDVPSLFRHTNGGIDADDDASNPPGTGWQLVARGVEDMQVEYLTGNSAGVWLNTPTLVAEGDPGSIIQQVRVTLWVRTTRESGNNSEAHFLGETTAAGNGVTAIRGAIVTTVAPRAAQHALAAADRWR